MNRSTSVIAGALLGLAMVGMTAPWASAANDPPGLARFEKAQAKRDFVVYAPTTTFSIPITSFKAYACAPQRSPQLIVEFGSDSNPSPTPQSISFGQAPAWCQDGPDSIGRVTTFTFQGAKVRVFGTCPGSDGRECARSTPALVKKSGYTTVILPGSAARPSSTYIEVYTRGLSVAEIRRFIRGLVPAL